MGVYDELEGLKFNMLTVLNKEDKLGNDKAYKCLCECGNEKIIRAISLVKGDTKSCGCIRKRFEDLTGNEYGKWKVLKYIETGNKGVTYWECECSCNDKNIKIIDRRSLVRGKSKSCGCKERVVTKPYKKRENLKSDLYKKIYKTWSGMKSRCYKDDHCEYHNYGGRGIKICEDWFSEFNAFYEWSITNGVELKLTIDRIDVNGNYEPDNCRWITNKEQQNNRRNNKVIEFEGKKQTLAMWEEELGFTKKYLSKRLMRGWSIERALTTPINKRNGKKED